MIKLIVHEAKTHLLEYFAKWKQGETIVLCKRTADRRDPSAPRPIRCARPIGLAKVVFEVPALLRTVAAVDHRGLRRCPLVMLIGQAIAPGLVILAPDPDITRYPLRTAW